MEAHFVTFYSPGTFVAESSSLPIDSWDVAKAKAMAGEVKERYGATLYGFRFTTRTREDNELDSKVTATSPTYYLGGTVETLEQVKARATDKERILVANMEGNKWDRIITNNNSWRWIQPLEEDDVVLQWP